MKVILKFLGTAVISFFFFIISLAVICGFMELILKVINCLLSLGGYNG